MQYLICLSGEVFMCKIPYGWQVNIVITTGGEAEGVVTIFTMSTHMVSHIFYATSNICINALK